MPDVPASEVDHVSSLVTGPDGPDPDARDGDDGTRPRPQDGDPQHPGAARPEPPGSELQDADVQGADAQGALPAGSEPVGGAPAPPVNATRAAGAIRHQRWWRQLIEWGVVAAVALVVAVLLRGFVVQTFYVPSGSMLPTLQIGDRIIVDKLYGTIHRYDIVVFRRTPGDTSTTDADLVKRVIGLPGETIWSKGDTIYVEAHGGRPTALNESWLPSTTGANCPQSAYGIPRTHIPAGDYFVMGDCRGNSEDSRAWGFVPGSYVVGKVFVVVWRHSHPWLHWF